VCANEILKYFEHCGSTAMILLISKIVKETTALI